MIVSNRKVYEQACNLLNRHKEDETINLKEECRKFENTNSKDRKKIQSLVFNYLNYKDEIKCFKKASKIKCKKNNLDDHLTRLMLTEILYSPTNKDANTFKDWPEMSYLNKFNDQISEKKKTILLRELPAKQEKKRKSKQDNQQLSNRDSKRLKKKQNQDHLDLFRDVKEIPVKYLRVNRLKANVDDLLYELINELDFIQAGRKFDCFNDFLKKLFNLKANEFILDYHFPDDLIVLSSEVKREFQEYRMYKDGKVIFQDKASLIPLKCANLTKGMNIADICCAPGMKTFGIASTLQNDCQIISIDIDSERIEMMKGLMDKLGVQCTKIIQSDFTKTTSEDFKFATDNDGSNEIDVLFLDPSCSGNY